VEGKINGVGRCISPRHGELKGGLCPLAKDERLASQSVHRLAEARAYMVTCGPYLKRSSHIQADGFPHRRVMISKIRSIELARCITPVTEEPKAVSTTALQGGLRPQCPNFTVPLRGPLRGTPGGTTLVHPRWDGALLQAGPQSCRPLAATYDVAYNCLRLV
jgi:hypothetical protein